ncbi:TonB family protein [Tsuneonella sp. YG55]|uniref:TonB family protein n=1 Tax=Tsuneonella litorea TaxID=2976475 RepID=A0A9X2VYJ1_9SPHN|nr:TonB family protein [Tsuneonella litorea]MCT2557481.1 TonB family protein [Tsuneonella litorea]
MAAPGSATNDNFSSARRRPRPVTLAGIVLLHVLGIYALAKAFAPDATASVEDAVLSTFTVTVETKEYTPPPEPEPDAGASGEEGRKAVPKPTAAPEPKIKVKPNPPAPKASSTGAADTSGAREQGSGTGAGGTGSGTGSGSGGSGQGGGIAANPVHVSGGINNARDYPTPPGGRQARIGTEVIVKVIVGTDGRASNCSIYKPSPDPEADAITCRLVVERLRFKPATDAAGNPVPAPFYWRQRWF